MNNKIQRCERLREYHQNFAKLYNRLQNHCESANQLPKNSTTFLSLPDIPPLVTDIFQN